MTDFGANHTARDAMGDAVADMNAGGGAAAPLGEATRGAHPPSRSAKARPAPMTEGPVGKKLVFLTVPVAWGILALLGYRLVEAWLLARIGSDALAAVSFAFPVTMIVLSLSIGLGAGASSVIARALGAGEAGVPRLVADALLLTLLVGVACAVLGVAGAGFLARLLGAGDDLVPLVKTYFVAWFPGAVLLLVSTVGLGMARAAGDAAFQGLAMVASSLLNLVVAPFAILGGFGWAGLGLAGAPVANIVAWLPLVAAAIWRLRRLGLLSFDQLQFAEFVASSRRILRVGGPAAATNTVIPVATGVVTALLAPYGHAVVAGFGLGSRVESVAMVAFFALSAIMNPFAGQNAGAGRMDRVREAMRISGVFCLVLGAVLATGLFAFRGAIAAAFTTDPGVLRATTWYLAVVPVSYGAGGIIAIANAAFNGLNRPLAAVAISVARTLVVNIPVAWLGGMLFGAPGIFLGICVANLVVGFASWAWVLVATSPLRRIP